MRRMQWRHRSHDEFAKSTCGHDQLAQTTQIETKENTTVPLLDVFSCSDRILYKRQGLRQPYIPDASICSYMTGVRPDAIPSALCTKSWSMYLSLERQLKDKAFPRNRCVSYNPPVEKQKFYSLL